MLLSNDTNNTQENQPLNVDKRDWRWWESDPTKLGKLQEAFAIGASDMEAVFYADITLDQLYYYTREINPAFQVLKDKLKQKPILKARQEVVKGLDNNPEFSLKYLERKKKDEFGLKTETEHSGSITTKQYVITRGTMDEEKTTQEEITPAVEENTQEVIEANAENTDTTLPTSPEPAEGTQEPASV